MRPALRRPSARADDHGPRGPWARLRGGAGSQGRRARGADRRVRRAGGAQHQGEARGLRGRGPAGAGDPGGRRHQHHRHRRRGVARRLRLQRPGPQLGRGRRAHDGAAAGDRPADRRQRRRPAQRPVGQAALQQGRRAARVHHGDHRTRVHRTRWSPNARRRSASRCRPWPGATVPARVVERAEELGVTWCDSLEELLAVVRHREPARAVEVRTPGTWSTRSFLAQLRPGAILLNTSRGDVVDEKALLEALDAGAVRAGLDVFADEPGSSHGSWDSALAKHPAVVATHHIGASTEQAQAAIAAGVTEIIDAFMTGEARHCVNLDDRSLGLVHADHPAPRPGRRARAGAGPAQQRAPQRRAHAEPHLPRR